jgi:DNA transformation protein
MAVTDSFRDFVLEQLEQAARDVRARRMFGGVGVYAGELFFAVIDDDILYFKVDDQTRPAYITRKLKPFSPYGDEQKSMQYYEVPIGVLEDVDVLGQWVADAVAAAGRSKTKKRKTR